MEPLAQRFVVIVAGTVLSTSVLLLGWQNNRLREGNQELARFFREPHRGGLVPVFPARTLTGAAAKIGTTEGDGRQVLFFFTTTCPYCRSSVPALHQLDAAIRANPQLDASLYAVGLDSIAAVRQFVEQTRLTTPVLMVDDRRMPALYRIRVVPQLIVLDSSGHLTYARRGEISGPGVIDSILAGVAWRQGALERDTAGLVAAR